MSFKKIKIAEMLICNIQSSFYNSYKTQSQANGQYVINKYMHVNKM